MNILSSFIFYCALICINVVRLISAAISNERAKRLERNRSQIKKIEKKEKKPIKSDEMDTKKNKIPQKKN